MAMRSELSLAKARDGGMGEEGSVLRGCLWCTCKCAFSSLESFAAPLTLPLTASFSLRGSQINNRETYEEALEDLKGVVLEEVTNTNLGGSGRYDSCLSYFMASNYIFHFFSRSIDTCLISPCQDKGRWTFAIEKLLTVQPGPPPFP